MEENLRRLTDEIGGRVSGSPEMAKAVDWAVAAFRAEGVTVHTEKYQLAHSWSEGDTRLEILEGAEKFPVRLVAAGWSPALSSGWNRSERDLCRRGDGGRLREGWRECEGIDFAGVVEDWRDVGGFVR